MWEDEIVAEIHRIRQKYAESFNYDLDAIFDDLRNRQKESGRQFLDLSGASSHTSKQQETISTQVILPQEFQVTFDGSTLHPETRLNLPAGTKMRVIVKNLE